MDFKAVFDQLDFTQNEHVVKTVYPKNLVVLGVTSKDSNLTRLLKHYTTYEKQLNSRSIKEFIAIHFKSEETSIRQKIESLLTSGHDDTLRIVINSPETGRSPRDQQQLFDEWIELAEDYPNTKIEVLLFTYSHYILSGILKEHTYMLDEEAQTFYHMKQSFFANVIDIHEQFTSTTVPRILLDRSLSGDQESLIDIVDDPLLKMLLKNRNENKS